MKRRWISGLLALGLTLFRPSASPAAVYNYEFLNLGPLGDCGLNTANSPTTYGCHLAMPMTLPQFAAGDQITVHVTFARRQWVPGSDYVSLAFANVYDANVLNEPTRFLGPPPVTDAVTYESTPENYVGPTPHTTCNCHEDGYTGSVYTLGYRLGGPVLNGFSLTGFSTTITILSPDPYPMRGAAVGFLVVAPPTGDLGPPPGVPEPSGWALMLTGAAGLGAGLRVRRRNAARAPRA